MSYTYDTTNNLVTNKLYSLSGRPDVISIEALHIPIQYNLSMFKHLEIQMRGDTIWKIPINLLIKLSPAKKIGQDHIIFIPNCVYATIEYRFSIMLGIPTFLLKYTEIKFMIKSDSDAIYSIIRKLVTLPGKSLSEYTKNNAMTKIINSFEETEFKNTKIIDKYQFHEHHVDSSGIFIQTNKKLNFIKFILGNETLFSYNNKTVKLIGQVIHKKSYSKVCKMVIRRLLIKRLPNDIIDLIIKYVKESMEETYTYWIPFKPYNVWNNKKPGCINLGYHQNTNNIRIEFDDEYSGHIYFLCYKFLVILSGLCGIMNSSSNVNMNFLKYY